MGARRWTELVADRKKWKDIARQAKAHSGLWCQWTKKKNIVWVVSIIFFRNMKAFKAAICGENYFSLLLVLKINQSLYKMY